MKSNRHLRLRREVMTALDPDQLRSVAAGEPNTLDIQCVLRLSDCVVIRDTLACPTEGLIGCPTTLDPPRCAGN